MSAFLPARVSTFVPSMTAFAIDAGVAPAPMRAFNSSTAFGR